MPVEVTATWAMWMPFRAQRVGELVEEADGVGRINAQDGVAVVAVVVQCDLDGMQHRRTHVQSLQADRHPARQHALCRLLAFLLQQTQ